MTISKDKVVQFHYRINDLDGNELESSFGQDPAAYLHGHNNMMVGIEKSLEGKTTGDEFSIELPPEETFGELVKNAEQRVSVKHLQGAKKWKPGMTAVVQTEKGAMEVTIVKMGKFMATVDTNHPLAGRTLKFDLKVEDVRDASQEELSHGHAHGVGGHHH
ncbi:FKBP-type peptidyl-prolyl cis-trans isomerase [Aliiglaciecola lipolytica]|uniref:Peptidyl-prolyl cis-trans isomerase n=1 Tax=Aliiglaciecola lipolytica E3 TaxID=1127673 RepID=K6XTB5_9ALTE|nr:peptidylprolyl isomerase [Aliiglaciecola lipolytica]GAC14916.1 FKBP-type peptidyl-prolyl cis-trans isomerase SlyD [Aliiglaciecola lipolytica E3]